jgi:Lrp/AsnC family transcriptional regulator for asnA, asnC and gidA
MVKDASLSYKVLGKKLFVSAGTIHVRMKKLQRQGVITGSKYHINLKKIGYDITSFVGIYLEKSSLYDSVAKELKKIPEIVRLNYTTGNYSMFAEVICRDMEHLKKVLHDRLQYVKGIERTETLISLDESFNRSAEIL